MSDIVSGLVEIKFTITIIAPKAHLRSSAKEPTMVPGFAGVLVSRFMEMFLDENGVRTRIRFGHKTLWSCYVYSIDGIRRGYARPMRNYRLEMELREASDTGFSDLTNVYMYRYRAGHPEATFWHILEHFSENWISY